MAIPASVIERSREQTNHAATMTSRPPFILVVDDNPDCLEMLATYLRFRGFEVIPLSDGAEAVAYAIRERPTVVLMDLQMPGTSGWEATRRLRANDATRDVIVIAVSAHATADAEAKALDAGCDAYVSKPYDIAALSDALDLLIAQGRQALPAIAAMNSHH